MMKLLPSLEMTRYKFLSEVTEHNKQYMTF